MFRIIFIAITTLATIVSILMGSAVESRIRASHPGMSAFGIPVAVAPAAYSILSLLAFESWGRFGILRFTAIVAHVVVVSGILLMFFTSARDISGFILLLQCAFIASFVMAIRQRHDQRPNKPATGKAGAESGSAGDAPAPERLNQSANQ